MKGPGLDLTGPSTLLFWLRILSFEPSVILGHPSLVFLVVKSYKFPPEKNVFLSG